MKFARMKIYTDKSELKDKEYRAVGTVIGRAYMRGSIIERGHMDMNEAYDLMKKETVLLGADAIILESMVDIGMTMTSFKTTECTGTAIIFTSSHENEITSSTCYAWIEKKVCKKNEPINVIYDHLDTKKKAWIDISKPYGALGDFLAFQWTKGNAKGEMLFNDLELSPGNYEVRVHFTRDEKIDGRFQFRVE